MFTNKKQIAGLLSDCYRRGCRSILRRGSRFNASDLSYQQSHKSSARTAAGQLTTDVDHQVAPQRTRSRSTDVASSVALLATIPLVSGDDSRPRHRQHRNSLTQLEVSSAIPGGRQGTATAAVVVTQHDSCSNQQLAVADAEEQHQLCRSDNDLPQSPHTEESRHVYTCFYATVIN